MTRQALLTFFWPPLPTVLQKPLDPTTKRRHPNTEGHGMIEHMTLAVCVQCPGGRRRSQEGGGEMEENEREIREKNESHRIAAALGESSSVVADSFSVTPSSGYTGGGYEGNKASNLYDQCCHLLARHLHQWYHQAWDDNTTDYVGCHSTDETLAYYTPRIYSPPHYCPFCGCV